MDATAAAEYKQGRDFVFAARTADLSAVKNLLADGVPVGFRDTANGANGWTALKWAASEGHEEVLELLLEHGAAMEEAKLIALRTDLGKLGRHPAPLGCIQGACANRVAAIDGEAQA